MWKYRTEQLPNKKWVVVAPDGQHIESFKETELHKAEELASEYNESFFSEAVVTGHGITTNGNWSTHTTNTTFDYNEEAFKRAFTDLVNKGLKNGIKKSTMVELLGT